MCCSRIRSLFGRALGVAFVLVAASLFPVLAQGELTTPCSGVNCDDNNECTADSCDNTVGCVHSNVAGACNDFNPCTTNDVCVAGVCTGGAPLSCDDGNECTSDTCSSNGIGRTVGFYRRLCTGDHPEGPLTQADVDCVNNSATFASITSVAQLCDRLAPNPVNDKCEQAESQLAALLLNECRGLVEDTEPVNSPCAGGGHDTVGDTIAFSDAALSNPNRTENDCKAVNCEAEAINSADETMSGVLPTDVCENENVAGSCEDGSLCTAGDSCVAGSCVSGATVDCNDGNPCTNDACIPETGCANVPNTDACDDGTVCNGHEVCGGGSCNPGTPLDCDDHNVCTDDSCDPAGGCQHSNNTNACDDGTVCNGHEVCGGGTCNPGTPLDCDDHNVCTDDSCDPTAGCQNANNTNACDDETVCNGHEVCGGGSCNPGTPLDCDDDNACTDDSCDPAGGCQNVNNTNACDDGTVCNGHEVCGGGTCNPGTPLDCDDHNVCTNDSCDPSGGCQYANNTNSCDDGNACTAGDVCDGGECTSGSAVSCDDENPCTDDACDPVGGSTSGVSRTVGYYRRLCAGEHPESALTQADVDCVNNSATFASLATVADLCDRLEPNPVNDKCEQAESQFAALLLNRCRSLVANDETVLSPCPGGGHPTVGSTIAFSDAALSNPNRTEDDCKAVNCEAEAINSSDETGSGVVPGGTSCSHTNNTNTCDDGTVCNGHEVCGGGTCNPGTPLDCSDGNVCTNDLCDPATGCQWANNTNSCDDGTVCNGHEICGGGSCNPGTPLACDDHNACTNDSCDPSAGCQYVNNTDPCDDNTVCNGHEVCGGGSCNPGTPLDCADTDLCTTDSCDPVVGCVSDPVVCDDDNACTSDSCDQADGLCDYNVTVNCDDNNQCTQDTCDPETGTCSSSPADPMPPACSGICRTPGFWGTHADADPAKSCSQDLVAATIALDGGSLSICGECLTNSSSGETLPAKDAASAQEALCVKVAKEKNRQLARHLTAAALNCIISGTRGDCVGDMVVGPLFAECNTICAGGPGTKTISQCIEALDCYNNGLGLPGADGKCGPSTGCHDRDLPLSILYPGGTACQDGRGNPKLGPAGSDDECSAANDSTCTIVGSTEAKCQTDSCP